MFDRDDPKKRGCKWERRAFGSLPWENRFTSKRNERRVSVKTKSRERYPRGKITVEEFMKEKVGCVFQSWRRLLRVAEDVDEFPLGYETNEKLEVNFERKRQKKREDFFFRSNLIANGSITFVLYATRDRPVWLVHVVYQCPINVVAEKNWDTLASFFLWLPFPASFSFIYNCRYTTRAFI